MSKLITRYSFTDDTGDGESGDIFNAALIGTSIYDKIDALLATGAWLDDLSVGGSARTLTTSIQLEVKGSDAGIGLVRSTNPGNTTDEGFVASYGYDSTGVLQKTGAMAFQWTDTTHATGYASWNEHASWMNAGVQTDEYGLVHWGNHGAAFFPSSLASGNAPGDSILLIYGALKTDGSLNSLILGPSGDFALTASNTSSAGNSYGLKVIGGGDSTDFNIIGYKRDGSTVYWAVKGDGGMILGSPTGGSKGAGSINVAADIYKNNSAYGNPDYVFESWATGAIVKHADKPGAKSYRLPTLAEVERHARRTFQLPRVGKKRGMFDRADALLEKLEEAYIFLFDHERRLTALEA